MISGLTRKEERELARMKQRVVDAFARRDYTRAAKALRRVEVLTKKQGPVIRRLGSAKISPTFRLETNEAAHLLQGLVAVDLAQIKTQYDKLGARGKGRFPVLQGIQKGTVRYKRYDPREHWKTWREIVQSGTGDCEDLSAAVVAELRYNGVPARTYVYQSAPKLYHVVVSTERWGLMDPSRAAGMEGNG